MRGRVGGRWQEIVVEKVAGSDRGKVAARLSSQGAASLHRLRESPPQKSAALLRTDCPSGSCVAAAPPMGSGSQFHKSKIQFASQDHRLPSRILGTPLAEYLHGLV